MTAVGDCVNGMLEYPRVVGHRGEMVERDRWEVGLDVRPQADWPGFGHPRLAAGREPALTASLAKARGIAPRRIGPDHGAARRIGLAPPQIGRAHVCTPVTNAQ